MPLEWNADNQAIKVYNIKGTVNGENSFDLNSWNTGTGGEWQEWYVLNGQLYENSSNEIECNPMSSDGLQNFEIKLHPNPTSNYIYTNNNFRLEAEVFDIVGKLVMKEDFITKLDVSFLEKGTYILNLTDGINTTSHKIIKE